MILNRAIEQQLQEWSNQLKRKPLLLRGARQVGKTYTINKFANKTFESFVSFNFEKQSKIHAIFAGDLNPKEIIASLEVYANKPIIANKTLLFFDEIQACPRALLALRYFYEEMPDLHIIAAGSLLEFALGNISFPVGRIDSIFMYPLSFSEFLEATNHTQALKHLIKLNIKDKKINFTPPTPPAIIELLYKSLREYFIVGGMPEAVADYAEHQSYLRVQKIHEQLVQSFVDDIPKYAKGDLQIVNTGEVFQQLAKLIGKQIIYSKLCEGDNSIRSKNSFNYLEKAMLCHRVSSIDPNGLPLGSTSDNKQFKSIFLDIGLSNFICGASAKDILEAQNLLTYFSGSLAEQFIGQQLICNGGSENRKLYTWIRNAKSSSAEVDYVVVRDSQIIPIEVKSGKSGSLKSLHLLLNQYPNVQHAICMQHVDRVSQLDKLHFVPLFCVI